MQKRYYLPLFFALVLTICGCDIRARLKDLPPSAELINFPVLSDSKLKGVPPSQEHRKYSVYDIEEKTAFFKPVLLDKIRTSFIRIGYEVIELNEQKGVIFAKRKTPGFQFPVFVAAYFSIDEEANKTQIHLRMQHCKENGLWTPDDLYTIGASIEGILKVKQY